MTDTGLPARRAALAILSGVLQKRRPLDAGLDQLAGLQVRDAGFARALASETLRNMGALDAVLRKFMAKREINVAPVAIGSSIGDALALVTSPMPLFSG